MKTVPIAHCDVQLQAMDSILRKLTLNAIWNWISRRPAVLSAVVSTTSSYTVLYKYRLSGTVRAPQSAPTTVPISYFVTHSELTDYSVLLHKKAEPESTHSELTTQCYFIKKQSQSLYPRVIQPQSLITKYKSAL